VSLLGVVLLPLFFCLPVFVWILVRWSMAVPALLAERRGPVQAIQRSWELTRGHWWRLFGILLVVVLIQLVMNSLLGAAGLPIAIVIPFVSNLVRGAVAVTVSTLAFLALTVLAKIVLRITVPEPVWIALGFWLWTLAYLWVASAVVTAVLAERALERDQQEDQRSLDRWTRLAVGAQSVIA